MRALSIYPQGPDGTAVSRVRHEDLNHRVRGMSKANARAWMLRTPFRMAALCLAMARRARIGGPTQAMVITKGGMCSPNGTQLDHLGPPVSMAVKTGAISNSSGCGQNDVRYSLRSRTLAQTSAQSESLCSASTAN